jgi:hypothetical protein
MNGSGFSPAGDGAPRPHGSTIGAPHRSRARESYGAQLRELSGAKRSDSARGSHPMVLGGGFVSSRASGGVLLLCFEMIGGGLLQWASVQGEGWAAPGDSDCASRPGSGPREAAERLGVGGLAWKWERQWGKVSWGLPRWTIYKGTRSRRCGRGL